MKKRYQSLVFVALLLSSLTLLRSNVQSQDAIQPVTGYARLVRATDLYELGIGRAFGLSYSPADGAFQFIGDDLSPPSGPSAVSFKVLSTLEEVVDSRYVPVTSAEAANAVFDSRGNRFLLLDSAGDDMTEIATDSLDRPLSGQAARHAVGRFGAQQPRGMAFDEALGRLYILDGAGPALVRVDLVGESDLGAAPYRRIGLSASGLSDVQSLAIDPTSGNIHIFDPSNQTLHELSAMGRPVAVRDLSGMGISDLRGMLFAPTGDLSDDPAKQSLFLLDGPGGQFDANSVSRDGLTEMRAEGGGTAAGSGQLLELSFEAAPAPAAATLTSTLVQTINSYQFSPPSPDSAGVAYLPESNSLLISDSEVNEMQIFAGVNLFQSTLGGTLLDTMSTMAYSDEPTGIDVNPANKHLFISDDTSRRIYEVNPGGDGQYDTSDDVVTEAFHTRDINFTDPEGVAYDSWGNRMLILDGHSAEIIVVSPGNNGVFDGAPPSGDDTVVTIDTLVHGITDPEGIAFNYENGNVYVVGRPPTTIAEMTISGALVQTIDISAANADKPAGLAYGPRSNNPSERSIYIAERGVDNGDDPNENDGKVYEMSLSSTGGTSYNLTVTTVGDGSVALNPPGGTYLENTVVTLTPQPSTGWSFAGWSGDLSGNTSPETVTMDGNKAVTATFAIQQFDLVTSVVGSGSVTLDPPGGTYDYGTEVTVTATPGNSDYEFSGWSGDLSGSTNPETLTMTANRSVTANFTLKQYTLTTATTGSGGVSLNPAGGTYDAGTVVAVTAEPAAGWEFSSWSGDLTGSTNPESVTMTADKSVTATFVPSSATQYTLTVTTVGAGSVDLNPSGGVYNEGSEVTLTAVPDPGWLFAGWSGDLNGSASPETLTMDADKSVTATFVIQQFDLATVTVGNGSITVDPPAGPYDYGTVVTLTASAGSPDWEFLGWSGDLAGTANPVTLAMLSDKSVTATFGLKQYSLATSTVGNGSVNLNPSGGVYDAGTVVSVGATPDTHWDFTGWDGDLAGTTNPQSLTMDADKSVTANFTIKQYSLTTAAVGPGIVSADPDGGTYDALTVVNLTATPTDSAYEFTGWSGDLSGTANPAGVTMDGAKSVTANFTLIQYDLSVTEVGSGIVTLDPPGGSYGAGTEVMVTATASAGWEFNSWGGALAGSSNPATITMDGDRSLTAYFTPLGGAQVIYETTVTGGASSSSDVSTSGSVPAGAGDLYLAAISTKNYVNVTSVSGMNLTWYPLRDQCGGRNQTGVDVWWAQGSPTAGAVTATLFSSTNNAVIAVSQYSGVESLNPTIGPQVVSANSSGVEGACSGGSDGTYYSVDMTTTAVNSLVYGVAALRNKSNTPGDGFTERIEASQGNGGSTAGLAVEDMTVELPAATLVDGTLNKNSDWAVIGVEIRPIGSGPTQYSLTTQTSGQGSIALDPSPGPYGDGTVVTLTANPVAGWQFDNWSGDLAGSTNPETLTMDANKTVTAHFSQIPATQYNLTVGTEGSGTVNLSPPGGVYDEGTVVTLTPAPASGWTFTGWSGDLNGSASPETLTMDGDKTVTATFDVSVQFSQASYSVDEGIGTATIEVTLSAAAGQEVTVDYATSDGNATAGDDYTAVSDTLTFSPGETLQSFGVPINDDLDEETSETVNLTLTAPSNAILGTPDDQATLTITDNDSPPAVQHSLTTDTVGDGSINLSPPGGTYDEGTLVTLTAVPDNAYWEFSGWSGDLSGTTSPESLTMDADKSVTATFTLKQYTLVTATVGSGSISVDPPGGTYDAGTIVTLTATAGSGWNFSSWSGDLGGPTNPTTLLMDGNKSVTANFSEEGSGGQVTHEGTVTGGSSDSTTVSTDVAVTAAANDLYLAAISTKNHEEVTTVSGMGLVWMPVGAQCAGRNQTGVSVWMAQGSPSGDEVVTASLASAPRNAVIAVTRYSGVAASNPVGNVASANTNGAGGACSGGSDSDIYSVDVTTTVAGALVYSAVGLRTAENTPGAGYTERADFVYGATGPAGIAVQEAIFTTPATVLANGMLSKNIDWAVMAIEIKPG